MRLAFLLVSALALSAQQNLKVSDSRGDTFPKDPTVLTDAEQNSVLKLRNREITANATMIDLQRQFEKAQAEFRESEAAERQLTQLLGKSHNCENCTLDQDLKWVKPTATK